MLCSRMWRMVASSERKSPNGPTAAMSSTARASSSTRNPRTTYSIMAAISSSMTSCAQSKVTPDSIIPAP